MDKEHSKSVVPSIAAQQHYWDQRWQRQSSPNRWQAQRCDAIMSIARDLPLKSPRILDLGCGTGFATSALSQLGNAEGIDLSCSAIEIAKARYPGIRFRSGDLYSLVLSEQPLDLVVCQEVIPHVTDQPRLVQKIADSLRPGGYLIMTAANKFVMARMKGGDGGPVGSGPSDPAEHLKKWLSLKELSRMMSPTFEIIKTTSILPIGDKGILRLINSHKLNRLFGRVLSPRRVEAMKRRLGWGYTIIVVGRKDSER